jgi:anaerobic selenocysteine-containing dehydrogenase
MYHSWDSQNAWLRQIAGQNFLYMNTEKALALGIDDMDWAWVESPLSKIRVQVKHSESVQPDTVWTWNAIGKYPGAWNLAKDVDEVKKGFILNHLITEELDHEDGTRISNSDPITGQAGWFDLRVKIRKAEETGAWPQFNPLKPLPHMEKRADVIRYSVNGKNGK